MPAVGTCPRSSGSGPRGVFAPDRPRTRHALRLTLVEASVSFDTFPPSLVPNPSPTAGIGGSVTYGTRRPWTLSVRSPRSHTDRSLVVWRNYVAK